MVTTKRLPETSEMRGMAIGGVWRLSSILLCMLALATSAAAQTTASGMFNGTTLKLPIADAYSYWDTANRGKDRVIKVAVSNAEFRPDLVNAWFDRGAANHDLFAKDDVKVVTFDELIQIGER